MQGCIGLNVEVAHQCGGNDKNKPLSPEHKTMIGNAVIVAI